MAKEKDKNKQVITNSFTYGAVGDRINGFKTSELYQSSARRIKNMIVTDMGTLKIARQFSSKDTQVDGNIIKVAETSENTYLVLTNSNIYLINKADDSIKHQVSHSVGDNADLSLIGKEIVSIYDKSGNNKALFYNVSDLSLKTVDLKFPIKDKKVLELSLWRVSKDPIDGSKLRIVQMSNFTNPKIKTKSGAIYLTQSDIQIKRIYVDYNVLPQAEYFDGVADGDIIGIMRVFYQVKDDNSYIIDNTKVSIGELTHDAKYKGKYFTTINGADSDGIFAFGNIVDITQPTQVSFYQDRTVFYVSNYLYFSKLREYFDFRNDINSDSPFFIQLNPINNTIGSIVGMVSANGLYILTTAGIYVIGYGTYALTPQSISASVIPATDMGVGKSYEVLDNVLYFINSNGVLKALTMDRTSQQLAFRVHTVDKYSSKSLFKDISKVSIDDKDYIMARGLDDKTMYLIEPIDYEGLFRKVALDFDFNNTVFGLTDRFLMGNKVFVVGSKNYKKAIIECNPPQLKSNSILVDNSSRIEMMAIKAINEDKEAILGVILNGVKIQNLPKDLDKYGIYRARISDRIETGYGVEIFSNENDKIIELQTIQLLVSIVEDL